MEEQAYKKKKYKKVKVYRKSIYREPIDKRYLLILDLKPLGQRKAFYGKRGGAS